MIELYHYYRSSASFRVRIALNLKGILYQEIPIHLVEGKQHSEDYKKINPHGLVPLLKDGNKTIAQSLAIIEYLEDIHPLPALLPKDSYAKAKARAFALAIAADLHPLNNLRVLEYLKNSLSISEEKKQAWYQYWIKKTFDALEQDIAGNKNDFCFGNTPGLADIFLVPQMYNARRFSCDLTVYPHLVKIDENCQQHEAFKKAWPNEKKS